MAALSQKHILIVEDSKTKAIAIRECVIQALGRCEPQTTDTIAIAGQLIEQQLWNGIVLDLAFHKTQQTADMVDRPYLAGIEILQQLNEMRISCPVVIATQHSSFVNTKYGDFDSADQLGDRLRRVFKRNYRGIVEVDLGETRWRDQLITLVREHFI